MQVHGRKITGAILLLVALIAAIGLVGQADNTVEMWGAKYSLASGSAISSSDIEIVQVSLGTGAAHYFSSKAQLVGSYLTRNISQGEIIPVSAVKALQVDVLSNLLSKHLPEGPKLYPEDQKSDQTLEKLICEHIREAAIKGVRQELPHSITVTIDEMGKREGKDLTDIHATIHVERDSQRGILLGHRGETLKEIGMTARKDIEGLVGGKCFLGLHIKVSKEWQRDPKLLERLGFME